MPAVRCFTGIPLTDHVVSPLIAACQSVTDHDRSWADQKWVAPENLHVTLKFLGSIADDDLGALTEAVGEAIEASRAFNLIWANVRAVPDVKRCRMLWASFLDPEGACADLVALIESATLEFGIVPETRPYAPHVTLVRARRPQPLSAEALEAANAAAQALPEAMSVPCASLFASRLTPRGPVYSELGAWRLMGE